MATLSSHKKTLEDKSKFQFDLAGQEIILNNKKNFKDTFKNLIKNLSFVLTRKAINK